MKRIVKNYLIVTVLLMGGLFVLTGCGKKMTTVTYTNSDTKAKISLSYEEGSPYKFINGEKDGKEEFRSTRDDATIVGDDFQIGIDVAEYFGDETFADEKNDAKSKDQFKEVEYNGISGFSRYYPGYLSYEVYLPINDEAYLTISIYNGTKDKPINDEKKSKEKFESEKIQNILKTIEIN